MSDPAAQPASPSAPHHVPHRVPHEGLLCALLAVAVFVVFGGAVSFPFIAFDDAELIVRNPLVRGDAASLGDRLLTPTVGYIVPITIAVERGLFALADGAAWSFHALALLLHALNASLVLLLALRAGASTAAAFAGALVFTMHPLVVQPIAWAICLKDLLMAFFSLAALHSFHSALDDSPRARSYAAASVAFAIAALLSKPTSALIGLSFFAVLLARASAGRPGSRAARFAALFTLGLGILLGALSRTAHDAVMGVERMPSWTPVFPLNVLGHHVLHALFPLELHVVYPDPSAGLERATVVGLACVVAIAACAHRARAHAHALGLLALAVATYLPVSNLLPFGRVMSDSYAYVPLAALGCGLALLASRGARRSFAPLALGVLALGLAASSHLQLDRWRGGDALWAPVVDAYPKLFRAHKLYADELVLRGEPERGAERFVQAFRVGYDTNELLELGAVLSMAGRVADAECALIEALLVGPETGKAAFNYAVLLAFHEDYAPRFPAIAKRVVEDTDRLRRERHIAWPPVLDAALQARVSALSKLQQAPAAWQPRQCDVLRAGT